MTDPTTAGPSLALNPSAGNLYTPAMAEILNDDAFTVAYRTISAWPGYTRTPLQDLPGTAAALGIASLSYKDEGTRFGLGSFKALGGAYAVSRLLAAEIGRQTGKEVTIAQLLAGDFTDLARTITVTCATDGNHGRSVAWGAQLFGCRCVIFIHATVSDGRRDAIARFGAEVRRTAGNYDDSVREAQETASREGWFVVSDTSYPGYRSVPTDVMQGYEIMAAEALEQLGKPPTHVFLQTGVGGMAAAVAAYVWRRMGTARPKIILADPEKADCWYESIAAGKPVAVTGDLDTMMAGLACGEISELAWDILQTGCDAVVRLPDAAAIVAMRDLALPRYGDRPIVAGESAVAGHAALVAVAADPDWRKALDLGPQSRVLLFGTEGDTDPVLYEQLIGKSGEEIRQTAADWRP